MLVARSSAGCQALPASVLFAALLAASFTFGAQAASNCQDGGVRETQLAEEAGSCTVSGTLSVCKTMSKTLDGVTTMVAMDNTTKVQDYFEEWVNPSSQQIKLRDEYVGEYVPRCDEIADGAHRKSGATVASICGYLKFNYYGRYFGCDATTNCSYAAQLEPKSTSSDTQQGHSIMQFPACESMKNVYMASCQNVNSTQIDAFIDANRINGTSWVGESPQTARDVTKKCKNKADGGVEFALTIATAPVTSTVVLCGSGDTDSECVHCSSDKYGCNSKDCKFEGGACVAGNGLMTATVDKATNFFLTLTVTLPYTKDQFPGPYINGQSKLDKYKTAVANAAGTVAANVEIGKITEARRRAGKVAIETKILAADQAGLETVEFTLRSCVVNEPEDATTKCKIDKALEREGLEKSTAIAGPIKATTSFDGSIFGAAANAAVGLATGVLITIIVVPIVVVILIIVIIVYCCCKKKEAPTGIVQP